jgi:hypothetical protein
LTVLVSDPERQYPPMARVPLHPVGAVMSS